MGVLYYKGCYTLMSSAPQDLSALKKAYPELRYDATGLLASGTLDKDLLQKLRAGMSSTPMIIECIVDGILVEEGDIFDAIIEKHIKDGGTGLVLEHQTYKQFGNSKGKVYRIDKGDGRPGNQTHIHVLTKHGQLFAMNIDGTTHDGSKAQLSKKDMKTLKELGFAVPTDGILEWYVQENGRMLLCD